MDRGYGCRVSSVSLKSGGARIEIPRIRKISGMGRALMDDAAATADYPDIRGYVVFGWDRDLNTSVVYKWDDMNVLQPASLPSFVSDRLSDVMRSHGYK